MRNGKVKAVALAGMLAAVALVIMCLGGLIPLSTYICPMLCALTAFLVLRFCGRKMGWVWYAAVAFLSLLMSPDKEAAAVFLLLGYYPLVKWDFERSRLSWFWKLMLFNGAVAALYCGLIHVLGLGVVTQEFAALGNVGLVIMLVMGNVTFILLDKVLTMLAAKFRR